MTPEQIGSLVAAHEAAMRALRLMRAMPEDMPAEMSQWVDVLAALDVCDAKATVLRVHLPEVADEIEEILSLVKQQVERHVAVLSAARMAGSG